MTTSTSRSERPADTAAESAPQPADGELARYLAAHAAPAACADALIRDSEGRVLLVDPVYKDGWDLPGGMLEDEEPTDALTRELREELGLTIEPGRLLVVDTIPASVWGRTIVSLVYAARPVGAVDAAGLALQEGEIRAAAFFPETEALALLAPAVARRLTAAVAAERGAHTAVLRDGHRLPMGPRDHYAQLPAPMMAATVVLTDTAGRVLVLEPSYKDHLELPGGMVEAHESPLQAAARELHEELGLTTPVGRLLVVDTAPASVGKHGRALTCLVYGAEPLTPAQAHGLVFPDGEIRAAHWLEREEAEQRLPQFLATRISAAFEALASGGIVHLERSAPHA
ncbi:NUDIX domain-containing protein [Kitasatospora sp. NPDC059571]|uniref:NUDIX domain-containing protein n=1 Tax=Kitasatospora sp. NPDC059571 TaxID=3346871 RepID=UPI00369397C5